MGVFAAFIPHGHCYLWQTPLVGLHAISDGLTALAYFSIPPALIYFVRRRPDLPFAKLFWLFSAFIVSCGITHLLEVWTLWHPTYWLSGMSKAFTAWISLTTALYLLPLLPQMLALPSLSETRSLSQSLWQEVLTQQQVEIFLRRYERIFATVEDGIVLVDAQGICQLANKTYLEWHHKRPYEVIDQPLKQVLGSELYSRKIQPHLDNCLTGKTEQSALWVEYPGVGPQFMSVSFVPYKEADGSISGAIIALRNLTQLKETETALFNSEATQRAILESLPDLLIHLNREGIQLNLVHDGEFALMDPEKTQIPASVHEVMPQALADLRMHYVHQALLHDQRQTYEHDIVVDGELRHEETRVVKLNDQEALLLVRDITDRKRRESQLRRYERIVAASLDGMALIDCEYRYQIVNDTYLHYFGRSRDEVIGQPASSVLGAQTFARKFRPGLDACLGGETIQYETWIDFVTVGKQLVRVAFSPYREADRTITGCIVIINNLTNLKRIEQALQESELRFRGIFEQMYQFVGLLTPDGKLVEANRAALEFGGAKIADIRGRPLWELSLWKFSSATQEQLREAITRAAQGEFVRHEIDVRGAQGRVITLDFSLRPVFNDAGEVVWIIPEGRDITDRIQVEKTLRLQAVVTRNMAEGVCLIRVNSGIIVWANAKFERMFGYGPRELNGQHVSLINHPTVDMTADEVRKAIQASVLANREATYEVLNIKKDGTPFWCQATTSVFDHPDYGQIMVAVQQDISDRKAAEAQVQDSLKDKELLLKEVYHRVKNNLQVIYSLLNLQSRSLAEPRAKAAIRDSQSRVAAMALVHEKLYQSSDLECIELADYISSLAKSLLETYAMSTKDIQLDIDVGACWLDIERAIPCGLILTELIANSFKYAFPEGRKGKLTITSFNSPSHETTLTIQDDGIGLPASIDFGCTKSLGLHLVQNLTKQLRGTIERVHTAVGTEFQLTFPHQVGLINGKQ
ncbi:MAG: PAS domain S-box protein [Cyanobacteria bacterium P01_C01_bin.70]